MAASNLLRFKPHKMSDELSYPCRAHDATTSSSTVDAHVNAPPVSSAAYADRESLTALSCQCVCPPKWGWLSRHPQMSACITTCTRAIHKCRPVVSRPSHAAPCKPTLLTYLPSPSLSFASASATRYCSCRLLGLGAAWCGIMAQTVSQHPPWACTCSLLVPTRVVLAQPP